MQRRSRPIDAPDVVETPNITPDSDEIALIESRNVLRQFDAIVEQVAESVASDESFVLGPAHCRELNRLAMEGLTECPGEYRTVPMVIENSPHEPPAAEQVPELVDQMCAYVNQNWAESAIHLASYLMWRLNWIHPFVEGNGRSSRAISYMVLCVRLGFLLPGTRTIPDQIVENRFPYYNALDAADAAWKNGLVDVSVMEELIGDMLAVQLAGVFEQATKSN